MSHTNQDCIHVDYVMRLHFCHVFGNKGHIHTSNIVLSKAKATPIHTDVHTQDH